MKTKFLGVLALAAFAFGIGLARPSHALTACQSECNELFHDCLDAGLPISVCNPQRSRCMAKCH
jgi:hypothetical protein